MKVGAITIGQAPRVDVTSDIMEIFNGKVELLQGGGLDGLTRTEIEKFKPEEGDYVLVSRLTDGSSVTFAERHILPRLQQRIYDLEEQGVKFIMFFCTGDFPDTFKSSVPLIFPCKILNHIVPLLTKTSNIITVTPSPLQVAQCEKKWRNYVIQVTSVPASPYGDQETLKAAAYKIRDMDGDLVILDCIGYTQEMKEMFSAITGKMIVLSRTILARVVSELTDV